MLYELWDRYRRIVLIVGILIFVLLSYWLYPQSSMERAPALPLETTAYAMDEPYRNERNQSTASSEPDLMYVDLKGNVKKPGLYTFTTGERLLHLIEKAGGLTATADSDQINFALPLADGTVIYVPAKGTSANNNPCTPPNSISPQQATQTSKPASNTININTASAQELQKLPGIGESRALAIISYREKHGPFTSPEQLKKVGGIGEKLFERIKQNVSIK